MGGFITKTEVENNEALVRELYGDDVFEAALVAPEGTTFLGLLAEMGKI
jgi:hypothetical protein